MQVFIGTIQPFAFNFAPSGWQQCNGQTLGIAQWNALFALLGTTYGGNGTTNFQLPNLQGRNIIHQGTSPTGTYVMGETAGVTNTSITIANLPSHTHVATFTPSGGGGTPTVTIMGSTSTGASATPTGNYLAGVIQGAARGASSMFATAPGTLGALNSATATISGVSTGGGTVTNALTGSNLPLNIQNPYLCMNYCIAMVGLFPSRN